MVLTMNSVYLSMRSVEMYGEHRGFIEPSVLGDKTQLQDACRHDLEIAATRELD